MTEDVLNKIPIHDFMRQATKELVTIINKNDKDRTEYYAKVKEVQLLQRIIVAKKTKFRPGSPFDV